MNSVVQYVRNGVQQLGDQWNSFWFSASNPKLVCALRIVIGIIGIIWILSFSADGETWYSANGLQQADAVNTIIDSDLRVVPASGLGGASEWSLLHLGTTPRLLWILHVFTVAVFVTFTIGLGTTVSGVLAWIMTVSYIHRSPLLNGPFENVFSFALLYVTISAAGRFWSVDRVWKKADPTGDRDTLRSSIGVRLLQFHLSIIYLFSAFSKMGGDVWWQGEAVWWMLAQPERCLTDLTSLQSDLGGGFQIVMNLWTYTIVLSELLMGTIIWKRGFRPLIVPLSCLSWLSLVPIAGNVGYCILMLALNIVFFDTPPKIKKATNDENDV